jgi:hypothetical protein
VIEKLRSRLSATSRAVGIADIFGAILGLLVVEGIVIPARYLPHVIVISLSVTLLGGFVAGWFTGPGFLWDVAYYSFKVSFWILGIMSLSILATSVDILRASPNWAGWTIFGVFLAYTISVFWAGNTLRKPSDSTRGRSIASSFL